MKQLLVICGLMTAVVGISCIGAIVIGHSYPLTDLVQAAGLNYCNAQICFRGVALGSDWLMAMQQLTPNINDFGRYTIVVNDSDAVYDMTPLDSDQTLVGQIEVGLTNGFALRLGDIVGYYGAPCLVSLRALPSAPGDVQVGLIYPHFDVATPVIGATQGTGLWALDPWIPVDYADFYFSGDGCTTPELYPNSVNGVWHGFTRYQNER